MYTPLRLLPLLAVLLEIDPTPPPLPPSPSLSDLPRYGPGVSFLYFSYLSFLTHADMGKTQVSQSVTDREAHVPTSDGCINDSG